MKKMNKTIALVLALVLSIGMMLSGCGGETEVQGTEPVTNNSGEVTYTVHVVDALGEAWGDGVIVRFLKGTEQVAMQVAAGGVAEKALPADEYTVELMFTDDSGNYFYDQSDLTLNAENSTLEIQLAYVPTAEPQMLTVNGEEHQAYPVSVGGTYVDLTPGVRNYFLFTPTESGTYEFSADGQVETIGYYGNTFFVQSESLIEVENNTFTESISADQISTDGSGTTVMVLGIDAGAEENCTLTIQRIGEPEWRIADEPWHVYEPTVELTPYKLSASAKLQEFDLTASTDTYNLVLNENDGFYHLDSADGPLVVVMLGVDGKYLDCFETIVNHSGVSKYFYDENGEFLRKESYTECLIKYIEVMDPDTGVYPLTEDLKYIIQMRGDHYGWFDAEGSSYLFMDENRVPIEGINSEISWLFMCCYTEAY